MVDPIGFDIKQAINIYMKDEDGQLNTVNKDLARAQWTNLKETYESLGFNVHVLIPEGPGLDLQDFVFSANTVFSYRKNSKVNFILSNMHRDIRKLEVPLTRDFLSSLPDSENYEFHEIPAKYSFESMGDLIWCYESQELFGGFGFRTDQGVYDIIEKLTGLNIHRLHLVSKYFYHLDTCLSILNSSTACYVSEAFEQSSQDLLKSKFENLIEIDPQEAKDFFAGNCHSPNGKDVILNPGSINLESKLESLGFNIIPIDTSEFMKSGGSVFCLKNQIYL